MARWYSDHFDDDGDAASSVTTERRAPAGLNHGRLRYKRATVLNLDSANSDEVRFCQMKSNDRIIMMYWGTDGAATAGTMDLGLYKSGANHDGAVIDDDCFATALDLTSEVDFTDIFEESTTFEGIDRGKTLWELANEGAGTYSVDPMEDWDITGVTDTGTDAATDIVLHIFYTSGD